MGTTYDKARPELSQPLGGGVVEGLVQDEAVVRGGGGGEAAVLLVLGPRVLGDGRVRVAVSAQHHHGAIRPRHTGGLARVRGNVHLGEGIVLKIV